MDGWDRWGLLRRFWRDERGAFAVIFAVAAVALIAMGGSAVDYTVLQQARSRAQTALDAAALALEPTIYSASAATIQSQAQALLAAQLGDSVTTWSDCAGNGNTAPCAHVVTPTVDTTNGKLTLTANLKVPMYFVRLVGVTTIPATIVSAATRKKLALEVAMVLDNSGSMSTSYGSGTRMSVLKDSATCAVNILFYSVSTCSASTTGITPNPNVKIGIVPFTMEVNIGPGNASASWIDRSGSAADSIDDDNFDSDDNDATSFSGPVDRISLFSQIKYNGTALSWGGCVEARKHPYDVDDTTPDAASPDTLFTPLFAPDEPGVAQTPGRSQTTNGDTFYNSYIADTATSCNHNPVVVYTQVKTACSGTASKQSTYDSLSCTGPTTDTYVETDQAGNVSTISSIPATIFNIPAPSSPSETYTSSSKKNGVYSNTRTRTYTYTLVLSNREYQERLCKYTGATMSHAPSVSYAYGPNSDCPANAVQALTSTPSSVIAGINAMSAQGGTNITEGAAWGWRVLSPTAPFSEGAAYSAATSKVMIVMTDGENTSYQTGNMNDSQFYSAYGYPWNSTENGRAANTRLLSPSASNSDLETEMNSRLSTVCTNAKALGVTIYTIGIATDQTSNPTGNQQLLTNCASSTDKAFFPASATELQDAFVKIANELAALHLSL